MPKKNPSIKMWAVIAPDGSLDFVASRKLARDLKQDGDKVCRVEVSYKIIGK